MGIRTRTIAAQVANSFSNAAAAQPLTLTSNVTFERVSANTVNANDFNISGNLTVTGTTTYINSTNLNIGDNIITLNADVGAIAPTENAGIEVNRGTLANVAVRWNETSDIWQSTIDGTTYLTLATNNDVTTAYSNAVAYSGNAALAYANAIAYAAANTYVNTQLGLKANLTGATFSGAVSGITTLAAGNTTITGFANVSTTLQVTGAATFNANLTLGTTTITANGGVGSAGQVLTSSATGNVYWSTVATTLDAVLGIGNTTTKALTTGTLTVNGTIKTTGVFFENATAITADYSISANSNAMTAGPISIANSATVTIPADSNWIIL